MKKIILLFFTISLLLTFSNSIFGCSYYGNPNIPAYFSFKKTKYIFVGSVISIKKSRKKIDGIKYKLLNVKFVVQQDFKSNLDEFVELTFAEPVNLNSCSEFFPEIENNKTYVVRYGINHFYAWGSSHHIFEYEPNEDYEIINSLKEISKKQDTKIYGQIDKEGDVVFTKSLSDAKISIVGDNFKSETITDKVGNFSFDIPKSGKYKIKVYMDYPAKDYYTDQLNVYDENSKLFVYEYEVEIMKNDAEYNYFILKKLNN